MSKKTVIVHTPLTIEDDTARYEFDCFGDWTGFVGTRRTMLKGNLDAAREDVKARRFVCACWPNCRHKGPA